METTAAVQQFNILPVDFSYRMPVELFGTFNKETGKRTSRRKCTFTAIKVISDIFSFSVKKDGSKSDCTRSIEQFKRDLNISESSVRRALKEEGYFTRTEGRKNSYQFNTENNFVCGGHYKLEAWMTRPVLLEDGLLILTDAEQIVAAFFNSECNRKPQELSAREIAERLDMSVPPVQTAINKLTDKKYELVYCIQKGVNGHKKSKYIINRRLFRQLNKAEEKAQKAIEKAKKKTADGKPSDDKPQQPVYTKAAIDREYYERKNRREDAARATLARAMADEEFKTATETLQHLAPKLAFATVKNTPYLAELQAQERECQERKKAALKRLQIDEAELSEEFYISCLKCRDKLFTASGELCSCFSRGAPPVKV